MFSGGQNKAETEVEVEAEVEVKVKNRQMAYAKQGVNMPEWQVFSLAIGRTIIHNFFGC
jgi:hypothetical protein